MKERIDTSFVNWRGFFANPGLPSALWLHIKMHLPKCTKLEWEAVRSRNGWVNIHNNGDDFRVFLENQEKVIGDLMRQLGFL